MNRRQVLATTAALLPLAGCLGPADGSESTTTDDPTTTTRNPVPTYEGASLETTGIECATEDATTADVSFSGTTVTVDGTIVGADMCYVAAIDTVVYDEEARRLSVGVESVREADEETVCAQCISAIEYTVTARFAGGLPDSVVVSHRRDGAVTEVANVTR
ncbi:MAG: hypothetical protein ABEJ77_02525 [Halanaeroarchaeum sp.]